MQLNTSFEDLQTITMREGLTASHLRERSSVLATLENLFQADPEAGHFGVDNSGIVAIDDLSFRELFGQPVEDFGVADDGHWKKGAKFTENVSVDCHVAGMSEVVFFELATEHVFELLVVIITVAAEQDRSTGRVSDATQNNGRASSMDGFRKSCQPVWICDAVGV